MKLNVHGERRTRRNNASVYLCEWPPSDSASARVLTRATADPSDRAHATRDPRGLLVNAAALGDSAVPRRYPCSQMTGHGVAFDSMFDGLYERQCRLDEEFGGVAGLSYRAGGSYNGGSPSACSSVERIFRGDARLARGVIERNHRKET